MRIVLADCYHDSDKGGGGIVGGALKTIYVACKKHNCQPDIYLIYRFSEDDPRFASAARLTLKTFPDVKVLPAPISSRRGPGLHWLSWAFKVFCIGSLRIILPQTSRHKAVQAIRKADIIIYKGGHFYRSWSKKALVDLVALYILTFPLLLARRLHKRYCLLSHSFGPFNRKTSELIIRFALEKCAYLSCRESISKNILLQCGLDEQKVHVTCDLAFAAFETTDDRIAKILARYKLKHQEYVAVTSRPWFQKQRSRGIETAYQDYIENMAALCDYVIEDKKKKIALVLQNDGAHSTNEPDIIPLGDIFNNIKHKESVVILKEDFAFDELVSIYAHALLTIGTRLHSCIFSFVGGTPSIAVAYSHKAEGIMHMMGADRFLLDIEKLSVSEGRKMIDQIITKRADLSEDYQRRVAELRSELYKAIEKTLFSEKTVNKNYYESE